MSVHFSIGEVARQTGIKVPTIRYYEQIGLSRAPPRSSGNRRCYGAGDVRRLGFIRHARDLGFEIDAIRAMLQLQDQPEHSCDGIDALTRAHLAAIDGRIARLQVLRRELQRMVDGCPGGVVAQCRIVEQIAAV